MTDLLSQLAMATVCNNTTVCHHPPIKQSSLNYPSSSCPLSSQHQLTPFHFLVKDLSCLQPHSYSSQIIPSHHDCCCLSAAVGRNTASGHASKHKVPARPEQKVLRRPWFIPPSVKRVSELLFLAPHTLLYFCMHPAP
jgi:hypothetical protein